MGSKKSAKVPTPPAHPAMTATRPPAHQGPVPMSSRTFRLREAEDKMFQRVHQSLGYERPVDTLRYLILIAGPMILDGRIKPPSKDV